MKHASGCVRASAVFVVLAGVLTLVVVCAFVFLTDSARRQRQAREEYSPPTVIVSEPAPGTSAAAGSHISIFGTAMGHRPIASVEFWLDGELKETQKSEKAGGVSPFYADFDLLVPPEGPHTIRLRAIDTAGLIGQSALVNLVGEAKPAEAYLAVPIQEGQTLDELAAYYGVSPSITRDLNQQLGISPPAGSTVQIPAPPDEAGSEAAAPQAQAGGSTIVIPDVPAMQIMSDRSTGVLPGGPFIPEPVPFNENTTPPAAPTGLQAEVKGCKITIRWNDNAVDEDTYYVYAVPATYHGFALPVAYLKASPATGPAWHELQPTTGGSLNIWVEASNAYGTQPSNEVWVYVPYATGCAPTLAQSLWIKMIDMTVEGNLDKAYCYVSLEKAPEQRLPVNSYSFVALQGGKSQTMPYDASFTTPVPRDGQIDLTGECDGWSGDTFHALGTFTTALPSASWNGQRLDIQGSGFQLGLSISPMASTATNPIESTDPTLPVPYDVSEDAPPNESWVANMYPLPKTLRWKWNGDLNKIEGFQIFLNGQPYSYYPFKEFEKLVQLPGDCSRPVRWQVAARSGAAASALSAPVSYDLPACQAYLRVRFDYMWFDITDDGAPGDWCDTLEAYFEISVREVTRKFWNTQINIPVKCYKQDFKDMTGGPYPSIYPPEPYVITIPLSQGENPGAIEIKARFIDSDPTWNPDDLFASFNEHPLGAFVPGPGKKWSMSETWPGLDTYSGYSTYDCKTTQTSNKVYFDEAHSRMTFSYSVYPNECRDTPPATGF
jgi:hypothetical protein